MSDLEPSLQPQLSAGVRIHVKAREVAAGNVQANAMSLSENVGSWVELEIKLVNFTRLTRICPNRYGSECG